MSVSPEALAAIAAILNGADATATAPAQSAPAIGRAASPFAASAVAGTASPATEAKRLYPRDQGMQRRYVATLMLPQWTCDVDTTTTVGDDTVPTALHGFLTAHETGSACPGLSGLPRGTACPGKVR